MHPGIHVAAVSLFSTTRFPLSVDPNDKFASSHFSNYAFIFPRVVKRFRTISFSKRWLKERGKSRKSRSILIIPLFALANPSVVNCHVNNDASSRPVAFRRYFSFGRGAAWLAPLTDKIMRRRGPSFPWSRASVPRRDTDGRISKGTRISRSLRIDRSNGPTFSLAPIIGRRNETLYSTVYNFSRWVSN